MSFQPKDKGDIETNITLYSSLATGREGDLSIIGETTLTLVYGNINYVKSMLGTTNVTKGMIYDYYSKAKNEWYECSRRGLTNSEIREWAKRQNIGTLHFITPLTNPLSIFFKEAEHAFIFRLEFGK